MLIKSKMLKIKTFLFLSKEEGKCPESIQSNTTPDPGHHMEKWQNTRKHQIQESQEVSRFLASDLKAVGTDKTV